MSSAEGPRSAIGGHLLLFLLSSLCFRFFALKNKIEWKKGTILESKQKSEAGYELEFPEARTELWICEVSLRREQGSVPLPFRFQRMKLSDTRTAQINSTGAENAVSEMKKIKKNIKKYLKRIL